LKGETEVGLRKIEITRNTKNSSKATLKKLTEMARIIDDLLLLSKTDTKDIELNMESISLRDLVADVCISMKIFANNKKVNLVVNELADVRLIGDELKLEKDALEYPGKRDKVHQEGGVVAVSSYTNNGYAYVTVKDNGTGNIAG